MVSAATCCRCALGIVVACSHTQAEHSPGDLACGGMPARGAGAGAEQAVAGAAGLDAGAGQAAGDHGSSGAGDGGERSVGEGGTGGDSGEAPVEPGPSSTIELALGFNVGIELPGAAREYTVLEAPARGELHRDGDGIVYLPPWAQAGTERFEYLRDYAGVAERHRVVVTVESP